MICAVDSKKRWEKELMKVQTQEAYLTEALAQNIEKQRAIHKKISGMNGWGFNDLNDS